MSCLPCRYANPPKRHMWYRQEPHYSSKLAIDFSHFRLLERLAAANLTAAVIVEDDAQIPGKDWLSDLLTTLKELPQVCMLFKTQRSTVVGNT